MIFSTRSEYGVMMLTYLGQHYGRGPLSLTEIADNLKLSLSYLEQIVPALRAHGLIESQRGSKGGYVLSLPPAKIRMGAAIRALEERKGVKNGNLSVMPCATLDGSVESCDHGDTCTGPVLWLRVRDAITQALDSTTLADLLPQNGRHLPLLSTLATAQLGLSLSDEALEVGAATGDN